MVSVTNSMSGCSIASSTRRSYHLETPMYNAYRLLCVVAARLGRPQTPDGEPQRVHGTDADQPEESGEVAGHYVCRVMHPEVEPGEADQEHHDYPRDGHGPPRPSPQPVSQDEREHPVEANGDGGVAARKRIEGGLVAGVEEFGTRPPEKCLQDGGQHD